MTGQDKRAVESMCKCGLDLDALFDSFPSLERSEVEAVYDAVKTAESVVEIPILKMNCS